MIHPHTSGGRAALLAAAASLSVITAASAAVKTWDGAGADDNWQTGLNWNADTAPLPDDQLVFAGTLRPTPSNNFAAATAFNGISISAGAAAFTLSGNAISLTRPITAGGVAVSGGTIINSSANLLTLALPVDLTAGKQLLTSPAGGGGINFTGAFSHSANSSVVFTRSGGHINFNGSGLANDSSGILGGWAVIGDDWATLNGSGNVVAYTGYTPIAAGAIATGPNLNYRFTDETGDITAATGTTFNTLQAKTSANRNLNITGQMRLKPNGGIYRLGTSTAGVFGVQGAGSTLTADGGGTIHLWDATTSAGNFAATNNNLRVDSVITNDGASPVSVNIMGYVQMGTGALGANTYSGGTFINQGRVQAGNPASFGTGPVTVYAGGQAFTNSANIFANAFNVAGNGTTETNGGVNDGAGAIRLGTGSTISGTVTYAGSTRLTTNSTGAGGTFSGRLTGTGPLQLGAFGTAGAIINLSNNTGTPNDWNGPLSISALSNQRAFTLRLGAAGQIPDATDVTLTGLATSTFELNGFNETIGSLNGAASALLVVSNMASSTTSTLTVGANNANGDFGGTLQDKSVAPTSTLNLVKTGSGKQILRGLSSYFGTTTVNGGTLECVGGFFGLGDITVNTGGTLAANDVISGNVILAGGTLRPSLVNFGQLSLTGNLTLGAGSTLDLNTSGLPSAPVMVTGTVTPTGGAGSVTVNLSGTEPIVGQHQLISYTGAGPLGGAGAASFVLGQKPPRMAATITEDIPNKALLLNVTASGISAQWSGALGSEWSTATLAAPKNWVLSTSPGTSTDFLTGDSVIFNDSATGNTVDISVADVTASAITFNNTDDDYTLTGSKGIIGAGILTKTGDGKLTVTNPNAYTGGTVITAGTVEVGNGGSLGTVQIHNEALLVINRSDTNTFATVIEGPGDLNLTGTGTTTLSGANVYDGDTIVAAGTARVTNNGSLGIAGPVQVLAGGAVDIAGNPTANNQNFAGKQFLISGNGPTGTGALVHSGTVGQQNAYQAIALEADASVGGTGRFDIRGGIPVLDLNGHILRKRGTNQFTLVGAAVEDGGTIIVEQGVFAIETTGTTNGTGSVIIEPGAYGGFYQNVPPPGGGVTWPYTLREGSAIGNAGAALATIPAPIILEGNALLVGFNASAPDPTFNRPLTLTGNITESGGSFGLTKNGISVVTLTGTANSYTGPTAVNAGSLIVDGALTASPVTLAAGATLGGIGTIGGTVAANGIVSPAMAVTGTLATGAVTLGATGSLAVQVNSGTLASDRLAVTGALNLGGATLTLADLGAAALPADTKFTIATYTGGISGVFANAADGAVLTVGPNKFKVDYDDPALGGTAVTLTVTTSTAYDDWATAKGLTIGNNGKLDDPDHDGTANILEFAFDGAPLAGARDGKTRAVIADVDAGAPVENAFTLTFPVRNGAIFSGPGDLISAPADNLIYSVRGSLDLNEFSTLTVTEVTPALSSDMPALSTGWSYRTFRLPGTPGNPNATAFLRISATEAAP